MARARRHPLRHLLVRVLQPITLPIRSGPLRGLRWSVVSGSRFLLGTYAPPKAEALTGLVGPGDVVCDVGAHMGYFTAIAALRAGPTGRVYAFEPRPLNHGLLQRHVRVNGLAQVETIRAAVGEEPGVARFESRTGTGTGRLAPGGPLEVDVVALDVLLAEGRIRPPDVIKVDVEGGELGVLRGAAGILERVRPRLLLATHGPENHASCLAVLDAHRYTHRLLPDTGHAGETELVALPGFRRAEGP